MAPWRCSERLTATIPSRWRPAWVGWWIFAAMAAGVVGGDFTDAGHTVAVILGVLVSARFRRPIHWTPVRLLMLVASSGFGFLVLAHHWATMAAALAFGLVGAVVAHKLIRLRTCTHARHRRPRWSPRSRCWPAERRIGHPPLRRPTGSARRARMHLITYDRHLRHTRAARNPLGDDAGGPNSPSARRVSPRG